jgi:hypothetical protein
VLFSEGGYTWLDVRPALEYEEIGKVKVRMLYQSALVHLVLQQSTSGFRHSDACRFAHAPSLLHCSTGHMRNCDMGCCLQGSVNIPLYVSQRRYDPESKKKRVVQKDKVEDWIKKVRPLHHLSRRPHQCA